MPSGCRVYIGNIPKDTREKDLERFFRHYGRLRDVLVKPGYGFVEFEDYRDADDAVYEMNGKELLGERVSVEIARGTRRDRSWDRGSSRRAPWLDKYGPPTRTEYRIIVENLSTRVSWQDLKDMMRREADVTYADAHKDRRNEGIVEFLTRRDMERAIDKFDGQEINGRKIKMVEDRAARRHRSYSRSRTRSRSNSRSRSRGRRSRADGRRKDSRSRSRSGGAKRKASRSRSRSVDDKKKAARSRSGSERKDSRSRSRTPKKEKKSASKSRSRSDSRRSRSEEKETNGRSRSNSRSSRSGDRD